MKSYSFQVRHELDSWSDVFIFDPLSMPLASRLASAKTKPYYVTSLSLFAGTLAGASVLNGMYKPASFLYFISVLLDSVDGKLARLLGEEKMLRRVFDQVADQTVFAILVTCIILRNPNYAPQFTVLLLIILMYEVTLALRLDMARQVSGAPINEKIKIYSSALSFNKSTRSLLRLHNKLLSYSKRFRTWPYPKLSDIHLLLILFLLTLSCYIPYLMILFALPDFLTSFIISITLAGKVDREDVSI